MKRSLILLTVLFLLFSLVHSQKRKGPAPVDLKRMDGFYDIFWDENGGKVYLEVEELNVEFLLVVSLPGGLGTNDVGLDRNRLSRSRLVQFKKFGPKVLLIQTNTGFRSLSDSLDEQRAVTDSFAPSVLWGFPVAFYRDSHPVIDATAFFLGDGQNIGGTFRSRNQGNYTLDVSRSTVLADSSRNFPDNTEIESLITFRSQNPGRSVARVAPDPSSVSLRQRHSLIRLPHPGYRPRLYDPRSGYGSISFMDFSSPLGQSLVRRYITRHRLIKKNPEAEISDVLKPIIYYVDRAAPEPIRTALIEGASWWDRAFAACGFRNAFQVRLLPEGADPMDVRYNMINWVHRAERGWSYGGSITDPRTGEIIKGHVTIGSQRIRQDILIAQGLSGDFLSDESQSGPAIEMALARIRQLSSHEVGHTLGLMHNYASSVNDRSSVMDYPHPLVGITGDGKIDLSKAYTNEVGVWDLVSIAYGYQDFPAERNEADELRNILNSAFSDGLLYLSDQDATSPASAHPLAHQWDNGSHPVDELIRIMKVRGLAIDNFSIRRIPIGAPMATLEELLVPVYLFHRYQIKAAAKVIGGLYYHHAVRGLKGEEMEPVLAEEQYRALQVLLTVIQPENLEIPEKLINLIPPRPPGYNRSGEIFPRRTGPTFDPIAAAETVVDLTAGLLLNPQRASRLVEHHARNSRLPALSDVLERMLAATWYQKASPGLRGELQHMVNRVVLIHLFRLAVSDTSTTGVNALALDSIQNLKKQINKRLSAGGKQKENAPFRYGLFLIGRFEKEPSAFKSVQSLKIPPGAPIGN